MTEHTHDHGRGVLSQLAPEGRELKALIPGVYDGFAHYTVLHLQKVYLTRKQRNYWRLQLQLQFVVMAVLLVMPAGPQ